MGVPKDESKGPVATAFATIDAIIRTTYWKGYDGNFEHQAKTEDDTDKYNELLFKDKPANMDPLTGEDLQPWDEFYEGERRVVFGHWAQRGLVDTPKVVGLDTGCVWGGALTAWIADENRFVSVPAKQVYRQPR